MRPFRMMNQDKAKGKVKYLTVLDIKTVGDSLVYVVALQNGKVEEWVSGDLVLYKFVGFCALPTV